MNNWIICLLSISSIIKIAFSLNNLEWKEQTLSILLKWNTTNNPDYIQVLRRRNDTNYWEMIAQLNSTENQYEDEKAKVIYDYFYKIRFVTNNNIKVSNTINWSSCSNMYSSRKSDIRLYKTCFWHKTMGK